MFRSYRPINNLQFFSKLIERTVLSRINAHMNANNLHCDAQFGYKKYHSTETMLLGLSDEVLQGFDNNRCTIVLFLDLSAAFDTIDIKILLEILQKEIGIVGSAIDWIEAFLTNRTQRVKIDNYFSDPLRVEFGVPQGSILGPNLFNVYTRSQKLVFQDRGYKSSSFADDANCRKQFSLIFQYDILKNDIASCMKNVEYWMNERKLKLNTEKTEIIIFHPSKLCDFVIINGTHFDHKCIRFSDVVKNVGFLLDKNMTLCKQVNKVVSHCYKLLKDIGSIRNTLTKKHTEMLVHSVITNRLDYCNSLYINLDAGNIFKLQKVQNSAARMVERKSRRTSARSIISNLHWLNVRSRVAFKILLLTYKSITNKCSSNLMLDFKTYNCRPNEYLMLDLKFAKTQYGRRTFAYTAPRLWNAIPVEIRSAPTTETFKRALKTFFFSNNDFVTTIL